MLPKMTGEEVVFTTPWFDLVAKYSAADHDPYYSIKTRDYVCVVALDTKQRLILVRQYRPAVDRVTLEIPSGHVEVDQTPEEAARQELLEETGYTADRIELLGTLSPDTGRLGNRMWCYFAAIVSRKSDGQPEPGIEVVVYDRPVPSLIAEEEFCSALSTAALFLAILHHRLPGQPI